MLMALLIMSITVAFTTFVVRAIQVARDSAYESIASRVAGTKIEALRAGGYDALIGGESFSDPALASLPQGQASTSIADWNEKTKQVTAGVSWLGADGTDRFVSMTTLVTDVGGL